MKLLKLESIDAKVMQRLLNKTNVPWIFLTESVELGCKKFYFKPKEGFKRREGETLVVAIKQYSDYELLFRFIDKRDGEDISEWFVKAYLNDRNIYYVDEFMCYSTDHQASNNCTMRYFSMAIKKFMEGNL